MKKPEITLGKYLVSDDKLIAALPDLLEALERFVTVCDTAPPVAFLQHISDASKQARQALKKAGYTF